MKNKLAWHRREWMRVSVSILCLTLLLWAAITVVKGQTTVPAVAEKRYQPKLVIRTRDIHVMSVAFSPDGKTLASGSWDKTIKLWNVESSQEIKSFAGHASSVFSVAFSPDGRTLASGAWDSIIKLWNIETGEELKSLAGHTKSVSSVAFSPDGRTLPSGSDDHKIKLWNVESGQEIMRIGHLQQSGRRSTT